MATWEDPDDDNSEGIKQLRAHVKKITEENARMKAELETANKQSRKQTLASVLKDKGVNAKVANLIPTDVEATAEAVDKWLAEYGEIFNVKQETKDDDAGSAPPDPDVQSELAQLRQMQNLSSNTVMTDKRQTELLAKLTNPDLKQEELLALIQAEGGGYGQG